MKIKQSSMAPVLGHSLRHAFQDHEKRRRRICFFSPVFRGEQGEERSANVCVHIEDGEVSGILDSVIADGGVGGVQDDGVYRFVPWPCAAVEVVDL